MFAMPFGGRTLALLCALLALGLPHTAAVGVRALQLSWRGAHPCTYGSTAPLALDEIVVQDTSGVNLARQAGAAVYASTPRDSSTSASNAVAGSNATMYSGTLSGRFPDQWFYLDLGRDVPLTDIALIWIGNTMSQYGATLQCYQLLWLDSSKGVLQSNYFWSHQTGYTFTPGSGDWPADASLRGGWQVLTPTKSDGVTACE
jgi:hypothetical protein